MPRLRLSTFLSELQRYGVSRFRGVVPGFGADPVEIELSPVEMSPVVLATRRTPPAGASRAAEDGQEDAPAPRDALEVAAEERGAITPADDPNPGSN